MPKPECTIFVQCLLGLLHKLAEMKTGKREREEEERESECTGFSLAFVKEKVEEVHSLHIFYQPGLKDMLYLNLSSHKEEYQRDEVEKDREGKDREGEGERDP